MSQDALTNTWCRGHLQNCSRTGLGLQDTKPRLDLAQCRQRAAQKLLDLKTPSGVTSKRCLAPSPKVSFKFLIVLVVFFKKDCCPFTSLLNLPSLSIFTAHVYICFKPICSGFPSSLMHLFSTGKLLKTPKCSLWAQDGKRNTMSICSFTSPP